jgi:hypothetical protein
MRLLPIAAAAAVVAVVVPIALVVRSDDRSSPRASAPGPELWTGTATLLKTPGGDLTLCGGVVLTSLPPAGCGGPKVRNLDPMTVSGAERFPNGTITTPSVRLVGTWDGDALTVTEPPVPAQPTSRAPETIPGPSCPEPAGGWPFDRVSQEGWSRVQEYAARQPDAGVPRVDSSQRILTVPFTGELDRHRADIAKLYEGPVCVELARRSTQELKDVFERVQADLKKRGLEMLTGDGGGSARDYVEIQVVAVTDEEKHEIESSYDGMLRLSSFLVRA